MFSERKGDQRVSRRTSNARLVHFSEAKNGNVCLMIRSGEMFMRNVLKLKDCMLKREKPLVYNLALRKYFSSKP